jgi:nitrate/nitrite transporter NarK
MWCFVVFSRKQAGGRRLLAGQPGDGGQQLPGVLQREADGHLRARRDGEDMMMMMMMIMIMIMMIMMIPPSKILPSEQDFANLLVSYSLKHPGES